MPERRTSTPPPARSGAIKRPAARKHSPVPVFLTMGARFIGLFGLLGVRMANGQDPALGAKKQAAVVQHHGRHDRQAQRIVDLLDPGLGTGGPAPQPQLG